ncbi:sodium-translocating pyrophosphatase [Sphingobacteriales bacterium UPWRP_1]|nr:sodium-translocating pyrophosphatase [Sphingobacteriales bacterium TSM_CSS]PSJ74537.1 sodium-translocating pyrophosphatase [Sphingobacteriales bacterium UPWRP_1]
MNLVYFVPLVALLGFVYIFLRSSWIIKQPEGEAKMKHISQLIANGAMAFLKAEYRVLAIFIVITAALLGGLSLTDANSSPLIMLAFVVGAVFSGTAGFIGMRVATRANVRTAQAARSSLSKALDISFAGGSVMGTGVVSLGLLGLSLLFLLFNFLFNQGGTDADMMRVLNVLTGFSLGAESIALFARVGGGIYTKAADVGADLAGKVVAGIPEDDPRNPAVIADNVGDNVGDVAGMGADLFGSYVSTVLATMVLGVLVKANSTDTSFSAVILPLLIAAVGTIFSMVSFFAVKVKEGGNPQGALNRGNVLAIFLTAMASYFIIINVLPAQCEEYKKMADGSLKLMHSYPSINIFYSVVIGLIVGGLISFITEFYCAMGRRPVMSIVRQSLSSPATNIIGGISVGMESTALPAIVLASGIIGSYLVGGLYGVAMAAAGMMATTGIQLAIDAFGPIADNAGGIAEMSGLPKEVRKNTDVLDAVGNTTAAIGKGFAIASAALTALALFAAFMEITGLQSLDISSPWVLGGLLVGGMIPYLFSSLAISSVGRAANSMVLEVQRQFREIKGLLEGKEGVEADYAQCITISTQAALREMMAPGLLAIFVPTFVGFVFGPEVLGGVLTGVLISGVLLAMFQSNAGGAWDNAKKSFEAGVKIGNDTYYKGSDVHKNSIVGDTVGDPFKDTSGPSMNILIKLTCIVALIIAPYIAKLHPVNQSQNLPVKPAVEQQVEKG